LNLTGTQTPVGGNLQARLFLLRLGGSCLLVNIQPDAYIHLDRVWRSQVDRRGTAAKRESADEKTGL